MRSAAHIAARPCCNSPRCSNSTHRRQLVQAHSSTRSSRLHDTAVSHAPIGHTVTRGSRSNDSCAGHLSTPPRVSVGCDYNLACHGPYPIGRTGPNTPHSDGGVTVKVAVMQPYFIPYIGYFQLVHSCDLLIYYIDIQFPMRSWINRNRLMVNGSPKFTTIPIAHHKLDTEIRDITIADGFERVRRKTLGRFDHNYVSAPFKGAARSLLASVLELDEPNLVEFLVHGLSCIYSELALETNTLSSSELLIDPSLTGQERVIAIARAVGADTYINLPGGRSLYEPSAFEEAGITLQFVDPVIPANEIEGGVSFPRMSIIDTIAHLGVDEVFDLCRRAE